MNIEASRELFPATGNCVPSFFLAFVVEKREMFFNVYSPLSRFDHENYVDYDVSENATFRGVGRGGTKISFQVSTIVS